MLPLKEEIKELGLYSLDQTRLKEDMMPLLRGEETHPPGVA